MRPAASATDVSRGARLVVMAKAPRPGFVKTRLAAVIGAAAACAFHRACLADLASRLAAARRAVWWAWTPVVPAATEITRTGTDLLQGDGDLGARMLDMIVRVGEGQHPVIVLGADAPHVPAAWWQAADDGLSRADVVLGPAEDGGYWAIGMRRPHPSIFSEIAWGTETVCAETRVRLQAAGLATHELPVTFDVDAWRDLDRLRAVVRAEPAGFPALAEWYATLDAQ